MKRDRKHTGCLNGLGQCYLEGLNLEKAEDCFERSMEVEENPFAQKSLKYIDTLQKGTAKKDLEKKQKKAWQKWSDEELMRVSREEQKKLVARVFVGR